VTASDLSRNLASKKCKKQKETSVFRMIRGGQGFVTRPWIGVLAFLIAALALVAVAPVQAAPMAQAGPTATVLVDSLNIRSGPGTSYKVAGSAAKGTKLSVVGQSGSCAWLQIAKGGKTAGWVSGNPSFTKLSTACSKVPAATAPAATTGSSSAQGCAVLVNQLAFDVKLSVKRTDGWSTADGAGRCRKADLRGARPDTATFTATGMPLP
ncbi:MAG: SH3 domain-containing protein, partial [Anaerolineales bacterium]|nr:SH3 domain-containing protein [Anaerolineales bacterium]